MEADGKTGKFTFVKWTTSLLLLLQA
jgi:hypothetical protein